MKVLSGIQPSGELHIGNYFGALKQHIELQEAHDCFYFIANYHSLTTVRSGDLLDEWTRQVAAAYLSLGLRTDGSCLFKQSDVPEVTELAWVLSTVIGTGVLERAHAFKDKTARGIQASVGLFTYPILMAADILIYQSELVPVGRDQLQHVEMAQDMAGAFNSAYSKNVFKRPEALLTRTPTVLGVDGQKMSKSYNNYIEIFGDIDVIRKRIMSIKTDSAPVEAPKDPTSCNAFKILELFASSEECEEWANRYRTGGLAYSKVKSRIFELFTQTFAPARGRYAELVNDQKRIDETLALGGAQARGVARSTIDCVRSVCGL